ncbi:insulin-like growth factor I isoform X2 [Apis mellifera]|uniref:Insulin-like growth factor I isoform X2 n=1 Tax=Apis mellifera TaxID=7460 RepID=A0A7M7MLV3_APIME|nr:insulin-like growth factor I isoform X2 [Apis mellifera]|eukprot:XP_026297929.1 insulin-like growth factor I isoform X2 [Apis mellifera]
MCIYVYIYTHTHIYIHIYIRLEKWKERHVSLCCYSESVSVWFTKTFSVRYARKLIVTDDTMPRSGFKTAMFRPSRARTIVLVGLVLLTLLDAVNGIPYKRSLLRLCSKSLSDALYLACKGRGYNEPFSYSGEDDPMDVGPGLAEECCYHQCSYAQLEQYCKPDNASSVDAVKSPVWIKYPYLSTRSAASSSSEERSRSDIGYVHGTIKCRIHGSKGARKKGANTDRDDDAGGCDGRNSMRRHRTGHCGCRHRRQRRRRPGKMLDKTPGVKTSRHETLKLPVSSNKSE